MTIEKPSPRRAPLVPRVGGPANQQAPVANRKSAMALIITLILLSITLVMAVAFLALARRERSSVTTSAELTTARLAADTALAAAEAQIIANINVSTNAALYDNPLLVSTNFITAGGILAGTANFNYLSYYDANGNVLSGVDFDQVVTNLWYLPRAPVLVSAAEPVGRFYLDLNRNGAFEDTAPDVSYVETDGSTNGVIREVGDPQWVGILERPDAAHSPDNKFISRYAFFAQPISDSLDINFIHNQAFTKTVNPASAGNDGFLRNQGVGSWEINLAAFLADLNTNQWDQNPLSPATYYQYNQPLGINRGVAFDDARALLSWRYNFSYLNLAAANFSFNNLFYYPNVMDGYSDGHLQTTLNTNLNLFPDNTALPWSGADNPNRFSTPGDFFDPAKSGYGIGTFTNRLLNAGTTVAANGARPTYDRYTFYRMMEQLGTDSTVDSDKMNLNYRNITNGLVVPGMETNLIPWAPLDFFANAADRMLRFYTAEWFRANPSNYLANYYGIAVGTNADFYVNAQGNAVFYDPTGFGLTNIPYYGMTNQLPAFGISDIPVRANGRFTYSAAVNRVLQLAANLYEATTNSAFPIVYRPVFEFRDGTNVFIAGYTNLNSANGFNTVLNLADPQLNPPLHAQDLPPFPNYTPITTNYLGFQSLVNVYGVPWIIGARKGFPNFNKLGSENIVQVTRKMQVRRQGPPTSGRPAILLATNQQYNVSIQNNLGVECWNSYATAYPNPVQIMVRDSISMLLTNDAGTPTVPASGIPATFVLATNIIVNNWPGYSGGTANPDYSFVIPLNRQSLFLPDDIYYTGTTPPGVSGFYLTGFNYGWETNNFSFSLPNFGLLTTNQFQLVMLDTAGGLNHVIDYVQLSGPSSSHILNSAFQTNDTAYNFGNMWSTAVNGNGLPVGILNQWDTSKGVYGVNGQFWKDPLGSGASPADEINGFCNFLGVASPLPSTKISNPNVAAYYSNDVVQLPYTPQVTIVDYTGWQANDPLVHYLTGDLASTITEKNGSLYQGLFKLPEGVTNIAPDYTGVNERYQPWGVKAPTGLQSAQYNFGDPFNLIYKDPLVTRSDNWDFPTNPLPSVGWIGRVHRGTPWQTVYLKARNVLHDNVTGTYPARGTNTWLEWSGDFNTFDAANSAPLQDRMLFDLFTTRLNENAARGTLSVNQTHLAAWSALFGGMVVLSNNLAVANAFTAPSTTSRIIDPAGVDQANSAVWQMVTNINAVRAGYPQGVFQHVGDVLSAARLTEQSSFLNTNSTSGRSASSQLKYGISDEMYEWLPQQALGLLRVSTAPRYVVYAYGQTLKPALDGTVLSSAYFGLVTNYQVAAESATRAIVTVQPVVTNAVVNLPSGGATTVPVTNYVMKVEDYRPLAPE